MNVFYEGLDANKYVGKEAEEVPDHPTRKVFADKMMEFFGWSEQKQIPTQNNQYNFFSTTKEKQIEFNSKLKQFLRKNPVTITGGSAEYAKVREQ